MMHPRVLAVGVIGLLACSHSPGAHTTAAGSGSPGGTGGTGGHAAATTASGSTGSGATGSGATGSGTATGSSGTTGSGGATGSGGTGGIPGMPTVFYDFVSADAAAFYQRQPTGSVTFGAADPGAHDGHAATLLFQGNTAAVGPASATEVGTNAALGFGEYRFRVRLATCHPDEDLVNGHFVYHNDGLDHDGNGIIDNDEIDIEILCGQPGFLNLTSWTDYTDDAHMRKKSRTIDLDTGTLHVGVTDGYGYDAADPLDGTVDPSLAHPGWYDPAAYYEMGWDWQPDHLRWFIVLGGKELTLWSFTDATRIPQHPAPMLFNLWHPHDHWNEAGAAAPAQADATLSLDWFAFTAGK